MTDLVVTLVGGLGLGGTFALIGLGLVLILRATGVFNFAHGQLMLLPALIAASAQADGWSFWLAALVSMALAALVGGAFYLWVLRRLVGLHHLLAVIATLGFALILDGVMQYLFGANSYAVDIPGLPEGTVGILGVRFTQSSLVLTLVTLVLAAAVALVMRYTKLGARVRAAGQDPLLASFGAIRVTRVFIGSWAVAAMLAAVAGIAYAGTTVVNPSIVSLPLAAAPAIVLGGLDSIEGAIAGGLLIGVVQAGTATYFGGEYAEVVSYVILLAALQFLPNGLFGTAQVVRT